MTGRAAAGSGAPEICPSAHHPWEQLDGGLARLRLPGGALTASQLRQVADTTDRNGHGATVTNRANLQLRGMAGPAETWVGDLVAVGLVSADPAVDARRNVLASPTSGVDPGEIIDVRPLVVQVLQVLDSARHACSAKLGILVDGGGVVHLRGRRHDLCLGARQDAGGAPVLEVRLAQALPVSTRDQGAAADGTVHVVDPAAAPALVAGVLEMLNGVEDGSGRVADLVAEPGRAAVLHALQRQCGVAVTEVDSSALTPLPGPSVLPVGALAEQGGGTWSVGAMPVLGHLDAGTLRGLAELAEQAAQAVPTSGPGGQDASAEVRLTPWRSVLLPQVPTVAVASVIAGLEQLGLTTDPADPACSVVACTGSSGCPAAHTDTQHHARLVISALRTISAQAPPGTPDPPRVHLSGCAKRCADRTGAFDVTLVGEPNGTYRLEQGPDVGASGAVGSGARRSSPALEPGAAIAAVLSSARRRHP